MPNQPKHPARAIRVDETLWAAVKRVAQERGETVSDVIRQALDAYVKRYTR